jgi:hypothetical protein
MFRKGADRRRKRRFSDGKVRGLGGGDYVNIGTESNAIFVVPVVNLCLCTIVMK